MPKTKHTGRKKKKYVNPVAAQRQQEVQYQLFFFDKLRRLCKQIGDESLFRMLSSNDLSTLYRFRGAPLKVVAAPGAKIKKQMADVLVKTIKTRQLEMTLDVIKGSEEKMTFADYSLLGMSLESYAAAQPKDSDDPGTRLFAEYGALRMERGQQYEAGIREICIHTCWLFDDMGEKYIYTYQFDFSEPNLDDYPIPKLGPGKSRAAYQREMQALGREDFRMHQTITIGTYPLDVKKITIDGETHVAIQVGGLVHSVDRPPRFIPCTLPLDDVPPPPPSGEQATASPGRPGLPIYIQHHALDRMQERIGTTIPCFYKDILLGALLKNEVVRLPKNRLLIACFANDLKIGYFVAEIVDGIVLLRTFLLLTNSGTPEGEKLAKLTGLQTEDRKYLAIDTLQGLANSDIGQNEAFCNLLRDAGCGSILELCEKINNDPSMMWLLDTSQPKNVISDLITEYLKPNADEEYIPEE
jgi:hypothetical protein